MGVKSIFALWIFIAGSYIIRRRVSYFFSIVLFAQLIKDNIYRFARSIKRTVCLSSNSAWPYETPGQLYGFDSLKFPWCFTSCFMGDLNAKEKSDRIVRMGNSTKVIVRISPEGMITHMSPTILLLNKPNISAVL